MAFLTKKVKKGNPYYYVVESRRDGPGRSPRQHVLEYIGPESKLMALALEGWRAKSDGGAGDGGAYTFSCREHGTVAALWKAAELVGVEAIIDEEMPPKTVKGMSRGRVLALGMLHRACDPGSKSAFAAWADSTSLLIHLRFRASDLDGKAFREAMDGTTEGQAGRVQERVVERLLELFPGELDTLHLDHSNYRTWIDARNERCVICKRGHNKQKRNDLRQFSLAMLTAAVPQLPLVWSLYEGNRNDRSEFPDFVELVAASPVVAERIDEVTVVFDGGGDSEEALSSLPFRFVCGHSLAGLRHLCEIDVDEYERLDMGDGRERLAHRVDDLTFSGVTGTGVLAFSQALYDGQAKDVERMEAKLGKKAAELQRRLDNPKSTLFARLKAARRASEDARARAERYNEQLERDKGQGKRKRCRPKEMPPGFDEVAAMSAVVAAEAFRGVTKLEEYWEVTVARAGEPVAAAAKGEVDAAKGEATAAKGDAAEAPKDRKWRLTATRDDEARSAHFRKHFGKKLTVTDRTEWSTEEILSAYADQECVENLFRTTKDTDHFSIRPQYHWTDDKIRVHVLMCLLSLVLAEVVRRHLADSGIKVSRDTMLDTLATVHDGWVRLDGRKVGRAVEELDGRRRTMWEAVLAMPGRTLGSD